MRRMNPPGRDWEESRQAPGVTNFNIWLPVTEKVHNGQGDLVDDRFLELRVETFTNRWPDLPT